MSGRRNPRLTVLAASIVIAAVLIVSGLVIAPTLQAAKTITETSTSTVYQAMSASTTSSASSSNGTATPAPGSNTIGLQGFRLCVSVCPSPRPFLSGTILVNNTSFLTSVQLFVNGTSEGTNSYAAYNPDNTLTDFSMEYSLTLESPPIVTGDSYVLIFVAVFQDDSTAAATTTVVAR